MFRFPIGDCCCPDGTDGLLGDVLIWTWNVGVSLSFLETAHDDQLTAIGGGYTVDIENYGGTAGGTGDLSDISNYALIYILNQYDTPDPSSSYPDLFGLLSAWLGGTSGRRLVIAGEYYNSSSGLGFEYSADIANEAATDAGSSMSINQDEDSSGGFATATKGPADDLHDGLTTIRYAASASVNIGSGAKLFDSSDGNDLIMAKESVGNGQVIICGDVNLFSVDPAGGAPYGSNDNEDFYRRLLPYDAEGGVPV